MPELTAPRYLPFIHNDKFKEMVPDDEGQWYRQEDYDALAVKLATCEADHKQAIRDAETATWEAALKLGIREYSKAIASGLGAQVGWERVHDAIVDALAAKARGEVGDG